jgi:glycosyltransferase involved in cell wall biosynthesis
MKIGIHSNQFDQRGSGKSSFDYVYMLQRSGHDLVLISSKQGDNQGLQSLNKNIKYISYEGNANNEIERAAVKYNISKIVEEENIDFLYMFKWGINDNVTPNNCKTGIHCVFEMSQPHGDVYAGVSEYIAKKYSKELYVPPIVYKFNQTENLRLKYNIPDDFTVIGRHGGKVTFNLPFVHQAVKDILSYRKDVIFMFLSTERFIEHERVIFLPYLKTEQEKFNYIHSCDVMLHARADGETFGVAVGEFSSCNKPIITWSGLYNNQKMMGYDTAHLELLGNKAIIYNEYQDLLDILYSIKREDIHHQCWDCYSEKFSEKNIINQFNKVFL